MPLPAFDSRGDLPEGVYKTALDEVIARFGHGTPQRQLVTARLRRIYELVRATGKLQRFIIFGSYITAKLEPNDVDILIVVGDDFRDQDYDPEVFPMFDHQRAQQELGASILWCAQPFSWERPWMISLRTGRSHATEGGAASSKSL